MDADAPPRDPAVALDDVVAVLGDFPRWPGATLEVDTGEIVLLQGPNGAGKTSLLRLCAGLRPDHPRVRPRARVTTWPPSATRCVAGSGCSGTRTGSTATSPSPRTSGSGARPSARPTSRVAAAMKRLGVDGRLRDVTSASCRQGSAGAPRSPASWRGAPSCGCSTSRTPASTRRPATSSTTRSARRPTAGATMIVASHELERAGTLATRWVDVVAGQIREAAP